MPEKSVPTLITRGTRSPGLSSLLHLPSPFRRTVHAVRGSVGSPTASPNERVHVLPAESHNGKVCMRLPHHLLLYFPCCCSCLLPSASSHLYPIAPILVLLLLLCPPFRSAVSPAKAAPPNCPSFPMGSPPRITGHATCENLFRELCVRFSYCHLLTLESVASPSDNTTSEEESSVLFSAATPSLCSGRCWLAFRESSLRHFCTPFSHSRLLMVRSVGSGVGGRDRP